MRPHHRDRPGTLGRDDHRDPMRPRATSERQARLQVHEGGLRREEVAEVATPNAIVGIRGSLVVAQASGTIRT